MNLPLRLLVFTMLVVLLVTEEGHAQQESQYTQYMYNTNTINPGYAGTRGLLSFNSTYRNQWMGMEGAPETFSFSVNTPLGPKQTGAGVGMSYYNDRIGPTQENNLTFDWSYTVRATYHSFLSLGLKAGLNNMDVNTGLLNIQHGWDENLRDMNIFSPVVGIGAYLHSYDWYIGLSSPNLLETNHYREVAVSKAKEKIHMYFIAGYVFEMSPDWHFKPALLAKAVSGAPLGVDVSANFMYREKFTMGASYRLNAAASALAGFQINDSIMIGYAYDYDTTALRSYNSGSHEIFLQFELGTKQRDLNRKRCFF